MITTKNLGIWMDHSNAYLMEFSTGEVETKIIQSTFTHQAKEQTLGKSEYGMHKKEQHQQSEYYKKIGEIIKDYTSVVLFGPTSAKNELFNLLRLDHNFEKIKIDIKQADKMTGNQQHAFVREYFTNPIHN
jgi:hypothetical protein